MKVLLVNLPWTKDGISGVRAGSRWPHIKDPSTERDYLPFPFFLAYAAAVLKKNNIELNLVDAIAEGISGEEFLEMVKRIKPDLLLAETATASLDSDLSILKKLDKDVPIALSGADIKIRSPEFLESNRFIDYVLVGEYEYTLLDLVQHLNSGQKLDDVLGLIYRDSDKIRVNPNRLLIESLDELPWPLREQLPMKRYVDAPGGMPLPSVQMWASRGCPFRCIFCAWPQIMYQANRYRVRDPIDVVDEMEYLVKDMGFKSIYFDDDVFNIGKKRVLTLNREIKKRRDKGRLKVPWAIMARADTMDEEMLEAMKSAGLHTIKYGVESGVQELIDNANKQMDLKKTERIIKFTKSIGIKTHLTFMFGLPGETKDTIQKTIDYALELDSDSIQFSIATPFPGTKYFDQLDRKGWIISKRWSDYDGNYRSIIRTEDLTPQDLEEGRRRAYEIWGQHCEDKRKLAGIKRRSLRYLARAFVRDTKEFGLIYALKKTARYITYRMSASRNLRRMRRNSIRKGKLKISCEPGKAKLYWDGVELTKDVGLNTSIYTLEVWHDSSQAEWEVKKVGTNKMVIKSRWLNLPISEVWQIALEEHNQIDLQITMEAEEEIWVDERKVGLMVSEKYRRWINSYEEGKFPRIRGWQGIGLSNLDSRHIGVRSYEGDGSYLPAILFDFSQFEKGAMPQIQNSSREIGARFLQARMIEQREATKYLPGRYKYFSGKIIIMDKDQAVDDYIEKLRMGYLYNNNQSANQRESRNG